MMKKKQCPDAVAPLWFVLLYKMHRTKMRTAALKLLVTVDLQYTYAVHMHVLQCVLQALTVSTRLYYTVVVIVAISLSDIPKAQHCA